MTLFLRTDPDIPVKIGTVDIGDVNVSVTMHRAVEENAETGAVASKSGATGVATYRYDAEVRRRRCTTGLRPTPCVVESSLVLFFVFA